jgi:hypothetical protein
VSAPGSILDRIRADFDAKSRRSIDVPEWGCTVYWNPLTLAERRRIIAGIDQDDESGMIVALIVEKALDAEGRKLFGADAGPPAQVRATLDGTADALVLGRISRAIEGGETQAQAKNA